MITLSSFFHLLHLAGRIPLPTLKSSEPIKANQSSTGNKMQPTRRSMAAQKRRKSTAVAILNATDDIEDFSKSETLAIRSSLLRWYDENSRDLPWRTPAAGAGSLLTPVKVDEEQRAYVVWVSEVMLQQTRVPTVMGYFNRWMEKWPTIRDLSSASLEEVNEMWAGLGYYRRARFLLEGAKSIVDEGKFPRSASELLCVKGIGDYTAGAIASIAFNEVVPVVDGNVVRVITRLRAISANPKEAGTVKLIWKLTRQLVDPSRPGDFNQALMELGATLCSSTNPACSKCPVSDHCQAFLLSKKSQKLKVTDYPTKVAKNKQRHDFAAVSVVEIAEFDEQILNDNGLKHVFLLVKRPENGLLAGLWEFPSVIMDEGSMNQCMRRKEIDKYLKKSFKLDVGENCKVMLRQDVGEYVHVFSHIRLQMYVELLVLTLKEGLTQLNSDEDRSEITWKCVDGSSIRKMGLSSGVRKVYNMTQDFKEQRVFQKPRKVPRKRR
ncbi:adenine DNA glycosylase isoform X2 [Dendrobium catenatum]|uniref:Adenine DNA glycosylase n=1 Tax=Dendrobium catenatum TaxID=906689 RepID=A0A2I0WJV2_9ASPA|nr:adenine DNA glycosylase isoform X2 [Dendrobium catenatum]PKU75940.1 A/G-specific adenine DNA glycosylase [Dendrobium catenatum]